MRYSDNDPSPEEIPLGGPTQGIKTCGFFRSISIINDHSLFQLIIFTKIIATKIIATDAEQPI